MAVGRLVRLPGPGCAAAVGAQPLVGGAGGAAAPPVRAPPRGSDLRCPFGSIDGPTAAALAQILPVLLLALMVEVRRTEVHRRAGSEQRARVLLAVFFGSFAVVETLLVVSIDGRLLLREVERPGGGAGHLRAVAAAVRDVHGGSEPGEREARHGRGRRAPGGDHGD